MTDPQNFFRELRMWRMFGVVIGVVCFFPCAVHAQEFLDDEASRRDYIFNSKLSRLEADAVDELIAAFAFLARRSQRIERSAQLEENAVEWGLSKRIFPILREFKKRCGERLRPFDYVRFEIAESYPKLLDGEKVCCRRAVSSWAKNRLHDLESLKQWENEIEDLVPDSTTKILVLDVLTKKREAPQPPAALESETPCQDFLKNAPLAVSVICVCQVGEDKSVPVTVRCRFDGVAWLLEDDEVQGGVELRTEPTKAVER